MSDTVTRTMFLAMGVIATALCLGSLSISRFYRVVPAFTFYLVFVVAVSALALLTTDQDAYWRIYLVTSVLDYLCEVAVMYELALQIAAFLKGQAYQSRKTAGWILLGSFCGSALFLAFGIPSFHVAPLVRRLLQAELAFDLFRVFFLSGILITSLIFGMRWRNLPLRIALCLSLYAAISLVARASQEYAGRLPHLSMWFRYADKGPVIAWSALMLALGWQFSRLPKLVPLSSAALTSIPGYRRPARR